MNIQLIPVEIAKLELKEGDVLVASLPKIASVVDAERVRDYMNQFVPYGVKTLVKTTDIELSIVRKEAA